MNVVVFGASGMLGHAAVLEALDDEDVRSVKTVGRRQLDLEHPRLTQIIHSDLLDFSAIEDQLTDLDACLWCLGISAAGLTEDEYRRITVGFTRAAAEALLRLNPQIAMCFISGTGTDPTGRAMWQRVKGEAENMLLGMGFARATMLRPAMIKPMRGVSSRTTSYRVGYAVVRPLWPLIRMVAGKHATDSVTVGRALLKAAKQDAPSAILENHEINEWVAR